MKIFRKEKQTSVIIEKGRNEARGVLTVNVVKLDSTSLW